LPRFMQYATQFIDPLFHSFFYMQLNIYYVFLDNITQFAEKRYDITNTTGAQIASDYEEKRTDAWSTIEEMSITRRFVSTSKTLQANRAGAGLGRTPSNATTSSATSMPRSPSSSSAAAFKKSPPPPPLPSMGGGSAPPPPYAPPYNGANVAAAGTKRAPPPPPALKPKPKPPVPAAHYVVALYDFEAQADGDLSFNTGDRIEIVEKTENTEDWWTGRLNGAQGVFPGNYVQDT